MKHNIETYLEVKEIPILEYGIYEIAKLKILELPSGDKNLGYKLKALIDKFLEQHPNAVYATGYEAVNSMLISKSPECVSKIDDSRDFEYGSIILKVKKPSKLLFILNH